MKKQLSRIARAVAVSTAILFLSNRAQAQYIFTTIDVPSATDTYALGISGNNIVGAYQEGSRISGFLYNGNGYTTLNVPSSSETQAYGTDGNNVIGFFNSSGGGFGFLYNGSSYTTLNDPSGVNGTVPTGISGGNVVGTYWYDGGSGAGGFLYNIGTSSYTALNVPSSVQTFAFGIDGNRIVGTYYWGGGYSGFLYDGSSYTPLNDPLGVRGTYAFGISGNSIVGYYEDKSDIAHGFLYNISTGSYTTLDDSLGVGGTTARGISGNTIVGFYYDSNGKIHGFEATPMPEPSTLALAGLGAVGMFALRRKSSK